MTELRRNPLLLQVPLYIAGKSIEEVQAELGLDEIIKLASNESLIGPSPLAVAAAGRALREANFYPGTAELSLRRTLAGRLGPGLDESNIVVGNGGTDVLRMITQAFVFDGGNTVMCRATFPMYHIFTTTFGGTPRRVAPTPDYRHDLEAMAEEIDEDTRLVFLCTPNNPGGHVISRAEADAFLARVPEHVPVVFDEAYRDYVTSEDVADSVAYVREGRNVLIVRSFSKSAGLANLRVGYLAAPSGLADYVRHAQLPFHSGAVALAAASASLDDREYFERNRQTVLQGRAYLADALRQMGLNVLVGEANFITLMDPPLEPNALADALMRRGVIVRAMGAFGMPNGVRVTIGMREHNERFVAALRGALEELRKA
ncbi:MAG: aminotransferase class I/II-fold pyridoxal phosphate-dependent enzyme [Chloroflexi bacterium]|nr:aminotransferase class I/II-fold pyridoxal phosphate-dependent enzyme [Chloroflexota bacterium]